jgi:hypothetical protein
MRGQVGGAWRTNIVGDLTLSSRPSRFSSGHGWLAEWGVQIPLFARPFSD